MVAATVIPVRARSLTTAMTSLAVKESRPEVGSSSSRTRGLVTSAHPMLTRLAWPPEMPRASCDPISTFRQLWTSSLGEGKETLKY